MYQNASTEPLSVIEANECNAQPGSLATTRFQACFNEIERLRARVEELELQNDAYAHEAKYPR